MDVAATRRDYGRDIAFWGGLGTQSTLPLGTPDDVRREVRERIELFADGGYILAPAGAMAPETPVENAVAFIAAAQAQQAAFLVSPSGWVVRTEFAAGQSKGFGVPLNQERSFEMQKSFQVRG